MNRDKETMQGLLNGGFYNKKYFEELGGESYGTAADRFPVVMAEIFNKVYSLKNKSILDAGCAKGQYVNRYLQYTDQAYGFDFSDYCMNNLTLPVDQHWRIKRMNALGEWDIPRGSFDIITAMDFLEHIPADGISHILKSMWAVLKPGGIVHINIGKGDVIEHLNNYSFEEWNKILVDAGFEILYNKIKEFESIRTKIKLFAGLGWQIHVARKARNGI